MLRVFELLIGVLVVAMICLGLMSALSGGGMTPAFQRIGNILMAGSPIVGLICIVLAEVLGRTQYRPFAYGVLLIPIIFWVVMIIWLQRATGFFG